MPIVWSLVFLIFLFFLSGVVFKITLTLINIAAIAFIGIVLISATVSVVNLIKDGGR